MFTKEEIEQFFEKIGLSTEEKRMHFVKMAELAALEKKKEEAVFIRSTASTEEKEEEGA